MVGFNEERFEEEEDGHFFEPTFFAHSPLNTRFLNHSVARTLIFDLHGIWCDVQQQSAKSNNQLTPKETFEFSRRYRQAINAIKPHIGPPTNVISSEIFNIEILWSLVECLYLGPEIPIPLSLIAWSKNCFGESNKLVEEQLNGNGEIPERNEYYWNALILSIIQVNLNSAVRLLRKHSRFDKDGALQQTCFFMESFQAFLEAGLPNSNEFVEVQHKIRDALQSGYFKHSEQLGIVAGLLIGKVEDYEKCAASLYDNWYELLPAYILFSCPGTTFENAGRIAQTLYNKLCPTHVNVAESLISEIDRPIFSILSRNLIDALKQICEKTNMWCFLVHFVDLLYHFDPVLIINLTEAFPKLKQKSTNLETRLSQKRDENNRFTDSENYTVLLIRSAMIIDYGKAILNNDDYWIIASDYLKMVSKSDLQQTGGEPNLHVKLDSVSNAEFIYSQAVKNDDKKTMERVAKWFVKRYTDQDCLSEALCWALRSNSPELINNTSNRLLSISTAESISQMRIFDAMAEQFYRYPGLLLLQRFYEFRRCLAHGQASEAATRIHELVTSGLAPIGFQVILFDQMTKLLDASTEFLQTPQLNRDSLYDLMKAVNKFQIQNSIINPPNLQKDNPTAVELSTKIKFLRQALCNALASRSLS